MKGTGDTMARKGVVTGELLGKGWEISREHLGLFAALLAVYFLTLLALEGINVLVAERGAVIQLAALLLTACGNGFLSLGLLGVSLKLCDGRGVAFADLFSHGHRLVDYLLGLFLYYLIVMGGLLLLIVPGLVWSIKYSFFPLSVLDKGLGPLEALRASGRITQDAKWKLSWLWGALMLVNLAGVLCLGIGLFLTIPITLIAYVQAYRNLLEPVEPPPLPGQSGAGES